MGDCVYFVEMTIQPCDVEVDSTIQISCNGACSEWILYQGAGCSGGAYASLIQDNCGSSLAALTILAAPAGQPTLKGRKDPQGVRAALQALAGAATLLGDAISGKQTIDQVVDPLLGALNVIVSSTGGSPRAQYIAATLAWRARNQALAKNASSSVGKIEAQLKEWQNADPTSPLARWAEEALNRREPAPDRAGCEVVDPSRVILIKKP